MRRNKAKIIARELPSGNKLVKCFMGERLNNYGMSRGSLQISGCGVVQSIHHSNDYDIVVMNFGRNDREFIVKTPLARRMVYTLKRGQYADVVGGIKFFEKNAEGKYVQKTVFMAYAFQGWFVPKQFDTRISETNEDVEDITEEQNDYYADILSCFKANE